MLVLDGGRLLTAEVAGVARMDYAVQAALELAYAAAQHDDNVGIMVFADGVQQFVAPQRGHRGLKQVLDVLAGVAPKLVEHLDRKSTRLNSSHVRISYAVFCLTKEGTT